ncbi:MAG TPA: hypothetical protein VFQ45_17380 [Longimicrobium sp.]|nr:hypothetical protein [Longimicrobium sp.]
MSQTETVAVPAIAPAPAAAIPAHKTGGRASALYAAAGMEDTPGQATLLTTYITQLRDQAADLFGASVAASLVPVQYNGDLNWSWTTGAGDMNRLTYNYVSGAVTESPAGEDSVQVGAANSFSNLYQQLVNAITWQFGAADNATLQAAQTRSQTAATSLVSTYVSTYGVPTPAQMQAAQAVSPLIATTQDYIVSYAAGYLWAGIPAGQRPLSLYTMQTTPNLRSLLQYAPASAQPTIQALTAYLNALGPAASLLDEQSLGNYTLQQIKNNLTPSAGNGGMLQSNPPTTSYFLGYGSNKSPSQILQELNNASQAVTVQFSSQQSSQSSYDISFSGEGGFTWGGELLSISAGTSFRGDVAGQQGSGSSTRISMTYPGVTILPFFPTAWQQTSTGSTGWFYEPIIHQAWVNSQAGAGAGSGFTFLNGVPGGITLGPDGLGYLSGIVVSGYPTITVNFTEGNYQQFSSWLSTHTQVSVSLFGFIPLGSSSVDTYTASASQSSSQTGFTLTLTPPAPGSQGQVISVPDQTVPVLAGQVFRLGVSES